MKKKSKKKLPHFKSETEEAEFWATHDSVDYWEMFEDMEESLDVDPELLQTIDQRSKRKQLISLRLEKWQIRLARAVAARRGVPYHSVIRNWVAEGIRSTHAKS